MAPTVDLRTYLLLERAFVRRLQRSWRIQSAPIYAAIAEHCRNHQWDKARQRVPDLDLTEVGTENREWITYMLLSCAVFGAGTVAKGKPSFVGIGTFDTLLKQVTGNLLQYLELSATAQVQAEAMQSIAEDEAKTKALPKVAFDPSQPRDKDGQWTRSGAAGSAPAYEQRDLEGAGPQRKKWVALNEASMQAFDTYIDAKEAHRIELDRVMVKVNAARAAGQSGEAVQKILTDDTAYVASQQRRLHALHAHREADEALKRHEPTMKVEIVTNVAASVAVKMGVDPHLIQVVHQPAHGFEVGGKQFTEAGHFDPSNGLIELNADVLDYGDATAIKGITSHECSHLIHHALRQQAARELDRFLLKAVTPGGQSHTDWWRERFHQTTGAVRVEYTVRPEFKDEFERDYPASMVLAKLSSGEPFKGISRQMVQENGHSKYAKSYWAPEAVAQRKDGYESAIGETLAEVTRYLHHPKSWDEDTSPDLSSPWVKLTSAMHRWYKEGDEWKKARAERIQAEYAKRVEAR